MSTRTLPTFITCMALLLSASPTMAEVERLDDSGSRQYAVTPQRTVLTPANALGDSFGDAQATGATLSFGRINYRLATAKYVGRRARIYLVIPQANNVVTTPAALKLEWRGTRAFTSGAGRPGDRVLVWQGLIASAWLDEDIDLTLHIDLRHLQNSARATAGFESYFEIEASP
jgi:hypothetical protein